MDIADIDRGNTAHSNCAGRQYDEDEEEEPFEARQPSTCWICDVSVLGFTFPEDQLSNGEGSHENHQTRDLSGRMTSCTA
jgi:hypothetical protein